ncbi:MAG TPA: MerR family DNA-binding transcriptional regulator [Pseudonocardia sp.]
MTDQLVPTGDAARAVGISPRTLARWARENLVQPALATAGGHLRWDVDDLHRQLREMRSRDQC